MTELDDSSNRTKGAGDDRESFTLTPDADAYVNASAPDTSYGGETQLLVDAYPEEYRTYLRFIVPEMSGDIERVTLRLYVTNPTNGQVRIFLADNVWEEDSVTWNHKPSKKSDRIGKFRASSTGWKEIDLTEDISRPGTYTLLLYSGGVDGVDFDSREGSHSPQLLINHPESPGSGITVRGTEEDYGGITVLGTEEDYDSGGRIHIDRPYSRHNDLLVLFLHRTDDVLPLDIGGDWERVAECFKQDNNYQCETAEDCEEWYQDDRDHDGERDFCRFFSHERSGRDLAQVVFIKRVSSDEPESYQFNLNRDDSGHPGWAILTALHGADISDPVRDWSHRGCDNNPDSLFPAVRAEEGDLLLLSQSFDDYVSQSRFNAPDDTELLGYTGRSDETGFLFGGNVTNDMLDHDGETGNMKTHGDGGSDNKDALISLSIRPE